MAMTPETKRTVGWIAVAVVVIAAIGIFMMPDRTTTGDSVTTGTPPAATDTMPATPAPATPTPQPATPPPY